MLRVEPVGKHLQSSLRGGALRRLLGTLLCHLVGKAVDVGGGGRGGLCHIFEVKSAGKEGSTQGELEGFARYGQEGGRPGFAKYGKRHRDFNLIKTEEGDPGSTPFFNSARDPTRQPRLSPPHPSAGTRHYSVAPLVAVSQARPEGSRALSPHPNGR